MAKHNLVTFKSHQEALDDWALKELVGHYVNYRKQLLPRGKPLLPEAEFRLYAVCSRYPINLAAVATFERVQAGVYDCRRGSDVIRIVVAQELPKTVNNAMLHLLSVSNEQVQYGAKHYRRRPPDTSSVLDELFTGLAREGIPMPYTMQDFRRDYVKEHFKELTPEERREALKDLPADEMLNALSPEEIEEYLKKRKRMAAERKPKKRK